MLKYIIPALMLLLWTDSCKHDNCEYQVSKNSPCNSGMDVAFLIDYTGSMGTVIDSIKSSVKKIANTIVTESGGDYRLALAIFDEAVKNQTPLYFSEPGYTSLPPAQKKIITSGPTTDQYLTVMELFGTANKLTFIAQLAKLNVPGTMSLGNGVGTPEPGGLLLNEILNTILLGHGEAA